MPRLAHADLTHTPAEQLEVAVLTYGPGDIYWERFGHDAIEIRDRISGESVAFNYGVFDFREDGFLLNFLRGHMHYRIASTPTAVELDWYQHAGRSIQRQQLNLTTDQKDALRNLLYWNLQPQNARYRYRYFTSNCATRVRDALDQVLGGALQQQLEQQQGSLTWRQQTRRMMAPQPLLMLLIDFGLAGRADHALNAWQESFLPGILAHQLAQTSNPALADKPLVSSDQQQAGRLPPAPQQPPDLRLPLLIAGALLGLLLILTNRSANRRIRRAGASLSVFCLIIAGFAGLLMLALWGLTEHRVAWANANLLLFNPLAWLLIPAAWRQQARPWQQALAWGLMALAGFALLANLTSLVPQRNLPWILLALPVWLAVNRCLHSPTTK